MNFCSPWVIFDSAATVGTLKASHAVKIAALVLFLKSFFFKLTSASDKEEVKPKPIESVFLKFKGG